MFINCLVKDVSSTAYRSPPYGGGARGWGFMGQGLYGALALTLLFPFRIQSRLCGMDYELAAHPYSQLSLGALLRLVHRYT